MSSWELSGLVGHDVIVSSAGEGTTQPSGACLIDTEQPTCDDLFLNLLTELYSIDSFHKSASLFHLQLDNKMAKIILSVNAGSSSVKITFYKSQNPPSPIVDAQVSGITSPPQILKYSKSSGDKKEKLDENLDTPPKAFKYLLERCLSDSEISEIANVDDLACICHRVVHGGDYTDSIEIDDSTYHHLEKIEDLAPL